MLQKTITSLFLASLLLLAATAQAADSNTSAQGSDAQLPVLRAVTDPSFPPFEMMDQKTKTMVGFDMDILRAVADRAGFDYDLKLLNFPGIIPALQSGTAQVAIAGIYITEERDKVVDFSDPYYHSGMKLLVPQDSSIESLEDLDGKKVATKNGSTSQEFLQKRVGDSAEIVPYPTSSAMYLALTGGSVDAILYDLPNLSYFISTNTSANAKIVGPLYEGAYNGLAFPEDSEWVEPVNEALAAMKEDGSYAEIYEKWFGEAPPED